MLKINTLFGTRLVNNFSKLLTTTQHTFSTVKFTFLDRDGTSKAVTATIGQNLLEIAKKHDVSLQGACEASLACSTCHVILEDKIYKKLKPATDEEEDLLDLAFGLTGTSRLGCQVKVDESFQGCLVKVPSASRNLYVDGSKPKH